MLTSTTQDGVMNGLVESQHAVSMEREIPNRICYMVEVNKPHGIRCVNIYLIFFPSSLRSLSDFAVLFSTTLAVDLARIVAVLRRR